MHALSQLLMFYAIVAGKPAPFKPLDPVGVVTHIESSGAVVEFPEQEHLVRCESGIKPGALLELIEARSCVMQVQVARERFIRAIPLGHAAQQTLAMQSVPLRVRRIVARSEPLQVSVKTAYGMNAPGVEVFVRRADGSLTDAGRSNEHGRLRVLNDKSMLFAEPGYLIAESDLHRVEQIVILGRDLEVTIRLPSRRDDTNSRVFQHSIVDGLTDDTWRANGIVGQFERAVGRSELSEAESVYRKAIRVVTDVNRLLSMLRQPNGIPHFDATQLEKHAAAIRTGVDLNSMGTRIRAVRLNSAFELANQAIANAQFEDFERALKQISEAYPLGSEERNQYERRWHSFRQQRVAPTTEVRNARRRIEQVQQPSLPTRWPDILSDIATICREGANHGDGDLIGLIEVRQALPQWQKYVNSELKHIAVTLDSQSYLKDSDRDATEAKLMLFEAIVKDISAIERVIRAKLICHPLTCQLSDVRQDTSLTDRQARLQQPNQIRR